MMNGQDAARERGRTLDELRLLRWAPKYFGPVETEDGVADMWLLVDDQSGGTIVSLGVPLGRSDLAGYVAACCGNPTRWVTSMWRPDPRADGLADPEGVLESEAKDITDVLFAAYTDWLGKQPGRDGQPRQANGWTLSDALSFVWFAFCGQLSHELRGRLLFRFLQLATHDHQPAEPAPAAPDAAAFVQLVARLTPYGADFVPSDGAEDAVAALNGLIGRARAMLAGGGAP